VGTGPAREQFASLQQDGNSSVISISKLTNAFGLCELRMKILGSEYVLLV